MPTMSFDRYYPYAELTTLLHDLAAEHPTLVSVESIGKSYEGRDIWVVTVTDQNHGTHDDKPAFWVDGNIHASELSASTAALCLVNKLVTKDEHRALLKTHTFYIVPRLNPDGAEWAMETPPRIIRSSTRTYPFQDEDPYGLEPSDLDGNGLILQMRIKDPNGPWKISEEEPRLMKRRGPAESGGTYYRLLSEGLFHNFDGLSMRARRKPQGLDINRNFPSAWRQEHEQFGAGPYPTSEPEIKAAVDAIVNRPNICGAVTFHTFSGVHLRPPSSKADDQLPAEDIWTYTEIGNKGFEMTGYPAIAVYHDFRYHPKEVITGVFDDWMYEHRGVYAWTTEIWSPQRQAGITDYKYIDWFREHPHSDDIAILKWNDEKLGGRGFHQWKTFEHPQLGEVEIGGWDFMYAFRNPPPDFLEAEVCPLGDWVIWQASLAPRLTLLKSETVSIGDNSSLLRVAVQNSGWLPTTVSKHAAEKKLVRGVRAEIQKEGHVATGAGSSEPDWLVSGSLHEQAGQLAGRNHVTAGGGLFGGMDSTDDIAVFEWVVTGTGIYHVTVEHERAGKVRIRLTV